MKRAPLFFTISFILIVVNAKAAVYSAGNYTYTFNLTYSSVAGLPPGASFAATLSVNSGAAAGLPSKSSGVHGTGVSYSGVVKLNNVTVATLGQPYQPPTETITITETTTYTTTVTTVISGTTYTQTVPAGPTSATVEGGKDKVVAAGIGLVLLLFLALVAMRR